MTIANNGNAGIGTVTLATKLDVNGTVKATAFQGNGVMHGQTTSSSRTMQPNNGSVVNNGGSLVTLTLPTSANIGDIVRVTGIAGGGWQIAQGSGQLVYSGNPAIAPVGVVWNQAEAGRSWWVVASSSDGPFWRLD